MKRFVSIFTAGVLTLIWSVFWWMEMRPLPEMTIIDDGEEKVITNAPQATVCEILGEIGVTIGVEDHLTPSCAEDLTRGESIIIDRKKTLTVHQGGEQREITVFGRKTLEEAFVQGGVSYDDNDIIAASLDDIVTNGMEVEIITVTVEQEVEKETVPFTKTTKKDDAQDIGHKEVSQEGKNGEKEIIYTVTFHNGEEYSRTIASEKMVTEAIAEITTIGTREKPQELKLGKSHTGRASWYAHEGCDCAANPWLPMGSYVKVTNKANGKSVVVRINDRGPFVPGRIIDLDSTAWKKIATLSAGVIDVKMEEVKE